MMQNTVKNTQELDLIELIRLFWSKKWVFLISFFICTSLGGIFAYSIKPVYQVKYGLMPPLNSDIAAYSFGRNTNTLLQPIQVQEVYRLFKGLLFSESHVKSFLAQVKQEMLLKPETHSLNADQKISDHAKLIERKWAAIKLEPIHTKSANHPILQVTANSVAEALIIGKKFIDYIEGLTKEVVYKSLEIELDNYKLFYEKEINSGEISLLPLNEKKIRQMHLTLAKLNEPLVSETPINRKKQLMIIFLSMVFGGFLGGLFILIRYPNSKVWPEVKPVRIASEV